MKWLIVTLGAFLGMVILLGGLCKSTGRRNLANRQSPPYDLGKELVDIKNWDVDMERFSYEHPGAWLSNDGAFNLSVSNECVLFMGYEICEDVLHFGADGLESVDVSIFNKGIAGTVVDEKSAFEAIEVISEQLPVSKLVTQVADDGHGKAVTRYVWEGSWPRISATMGHVADGDRGYVEYLNVRLERSKTATGFKTFRDLADNVRRKGGDIYIEGIPMLNQGQKEYCVPATVTRVLQYYGIDTDMHELALLLETDCGGGTKVGGRFSTLSRVAEQAGMRRIDYKNLEHCDDAYIARYNQAARVNHKRELHIEEFTVEEEKDGKIVNLLHYDWLEDAMEADVKRLSRDYDNEGFAAFQEGIVSNVQKGHPLLWSVERLFPWERRSDNSQGDGHMRLIVGVNPTRGEILYSDSWGVGNEFKRASFADAWRETNFLSCVSPK